TDPKGTETTIQKHPWGSFKVGSSVTMKNSGMGVMSEMKMTLVNLDADFATVKSEMKMGENTMPATEMKMALKGYATMAGSTVKELSKKNEDLKIGDKTFACEAIEIEETTTAGSCVRTTWYCKDAPTGVLQVVAKMKMGETETTSKTTVTKLEDAVTVAGKELKCIVFETVSDGAMGKSTSKLWQTDQIPGFSAKMETEMKIGENTMKTTMEVIAFEVK
ncbi:MAG: hypothetical protein RDV41_06195, partial [Planctomycetota bacterium]|nr:hypothetical protein [Planctomycetota bacterium]